MRSFNDNKGRTWTVEVTVASIKRVKAMVGVFLPAVLDDDAALLKRLGSDVVLVCDVLYVLVKPQADAAGVSDEKFGESLAGDAIGSATAALMEALIDFFPDARRRGLLMQLLEQGRTVEGLALDLVEQRMPEALRQGTESVLQKLGSSSGSSPAPSESTPPP